MLPADARSATSAPTSAPRAPALRAPVSARASQYDHSTASTFHAGSHNRHPMQQSPLPASPTRSPSPAPRRTPADARDETPHTSIHTRTPQPASGPRAPAHVHTPQAQTSTHPPPVQTHPDPLKTAATPAPAPGSTSPS